MLECYVCKTSLFNLQPLRKICENHTYCITCVSNHYAKKTFIRCEICTDLMLLSNRSSILKWFFGVSCNICKGINNLILICDKHEICQKCLFQKFHPSYSANSQEKCDICTIILSRSCRRCFSILEENEICYKTSCGVHIYCSECKNEAIDKSLCESCPNHIDSPTHISSSTIPSNPYFSQVKTPKIRTQASTNETLSNPYFNPPKHANQSSHPNKTNTEINSEIKRTQSSTFFQNQDSLYNESDMRKSYSGFQFGQNSGCVGCGNLNFIVLECKHLYCFECILINFQKDLVEFLDLIETRNFLALNSREICMKCPAGEMCGVKFLFAFDLGAYLYHQPLGTQFRKQMPLEKWQIGMQSDGIGLRLKF